MQPDTNNLYHPIGQGYVKAPTSVTDPYPCLLQPEGLTALERYKLFWLYCHAFIVLPRGEESWKWKSQLGAESSAASSDLFCQAFVEIYSRSHSWLEPKKCGGCSLCEGSICSRLTYYYQVLLKNQLFCAAQDYAWNMFNFWANPAGRLRDLEEIRNKSGIFPGKGLNIPEIFIPYEPTTNQPEMEPIMPAEKFTEEIFTPSTPVLTVKEALNNDSLDKENPYFLLVDGLTTLDVYKLYWHYSSQYYMSDNLWPWNWRWQFGIKDGVTIWNIFCALETEKIGEINSCNGCPLHHCPGCGEVTAVHNFLIKSGKDRLTSRLALALRDFWDDPRRARFTISKLMGEVEAFAYDRVDIPDIPAPHTDIPDIDSQL